MQYNHFHSSSHQSNPSSPSPDDYSSSYSDPSHQHAALSYAAVTPATSLPAGSIAHHNVSPQYTYSPYATQGNPDDHRSYYAPSSQSSAIEHYPASSSPPTAYASPSHHTHLPHPQQQFIPTPSQTYQVFSSNGSPTTRPRQAMEPYYHMSPNPQHAPAASIAHGPGSRSTTAHGASSSHSHHAQACTHSTHIGTIPGAAGERYMCNRCDRSFTRSHDRRRHYETVHSTSPALHKCRFCHKDFSRSDSLKRHVDNGCDDMPR